MVFKIISATLNTTFNINGTTIFNPYYSGSSGCYMVNAIVPPGATYGLGGSHGLSYWFELTN